MHSESTYYRKDGRWECRITLGKDESGRRIKRSFYGHTREEAERKAMISRENSGDIYTVTEMTVSELISGWFCAVSARLKASTVANYRMKIEKHLIPAFGNRPCCALRSKDVCAFIEEKLKHGLSVRYVADIIVLLKSVFRYASREYHIQNAIESVAVPKKTKPQIRILSEGEQRSLERYIGINQNLTTLGVSISLHMGLRIGELCALKWQDIDFEKRTLTVRHTLQRIKTKNGAKKTKLILSGPKSESSMREIPIPECVMKMMKKFRNSEDYYVLSGTEKPIEPRTVQYRFAKILKNENLPSVHFHSLRHLFATNCVALGFDVKTLSELLGHSSVGITLNRYVHTSMARKRACMDLIKAA